LGVEQEERTGKVPRLQIKMSHRDANGTGKEGSLRGEYRGGAFARGRSFELAREEGEDRTRGEKRGDKGGPVKRSSTMSSCKKS